MKRGKANFNWKLVIRGCVNETDYPLYPINDMEQHKVTVGEVFTYEPSFFAGFVMVQDSLEVIEVKRDTVLSEILFVST